MVASETMFEEMATYSIEIDRKITSKTGSDVQVDCLTGTYKKLNLDWCSLLWWRGCNMKVPCVCESLVEILFIMKTSAAYYKHKNLLHMEIWIFSSPGR